MFSLVDTEVGYCEVFQYNLPLSVSKWTATLFTIYSNYNNAEFDGSHFLTFFFIWKRGLFFINILCPTFFIIILYVLLLLWLKEQDWTKPDDPCCPVWFESILCFRGSKNIWPISEKSIRDSVSCLCFKSLKILKLLLFLGFKWGRKYRFLSRWCLRLWVSLRVCDRRQLTIIFCIKCDFD